MGKNRSSANMAKLCSAATASLVACTLQFVNAAEAQVCRDFLAPIMFSTLPDSEAIHFTLGDFNNDQHLDIAYAGVLQTYLQVQLNCMFDSEVATALFPMPQVIKLARSLNPQQFILTPKTSMVTVIWMSFSPLRFPTMTIYSLCRTMGWEYFLSPVPLRLAKIQAACTRPTLTATKTLILQYQMH